MLFFLFFFLLFLLKFYCKAASLILQFIIHSGGGCDCKVLLVLVLLCAHACMLEFFMMFLGTLKKSGTWKTWKTLNLLTCLDRTTDTKKIQKKEKKKSRCQVGWVICHVSRVTSHMPEPEPRTFPLLTPPLCTAGCFAKTQKNTFFHGAILDISDPKLKILRCRKFVNGKK